MPGRWPEKAFSAALDAILGHHGAAEADPAIHCANQMPSATLIPLATPWPRTAGPVVQGPSTTALLSSLLGLAAATWLPEAAGTSRRCQSWEMPGSSRRV